MKYIDLHTHTNCSDGRVAPEHSLAEAEKLGLSLFSFSDHNTVEAYSNLTDIRHLFGGKILPAAELSTTFKGDVIEILGYGIDTEKMRGLISQNYFTFYEKQVREARLDTDALLAAGAKLDEEFVRAMKEEPHTIFDPSRETNRPYLLREMQRHPENVRFFESEEEFLNLTPQRFSRDYLFNAQSALYSDQSSLSPDLMTLLDMINTCGGLAFLAHPFVYSQNVISSLDDLAASGIDGMECFYGTFTSEQKKFLFDYCEEKGLFKSGGSDFHGLKMRPKNIIGYSDGEKIPFSLIEPWFKKVERSLI
ncbi:MAG: PHP domain-containing protein [Clostridia bacterium]|nr:PHP domain-containing protein [Clostridia bacterium]